MTRSLARLKAFFVAFGPFFNFGSNFFIWCTFPLVSCFFFVLFSYVILMKENLRRHFSLYLLTKQAWKMRIFFGLVKLPVGSVAYLMCGAKIYQDIWDVKNSVHITIFFFLSLFNWRTRWLRLVGWTVEMCT